MVCQEIVQRLFLLLLLLRSSHLLLYIALVWSLRSYGLPGNRPEIVSSSSSPQELPSPLHRSCLVSRLAHWSPLAFEDQTHEEGPAVFQKLQEKPALWGLFQCQVCSLSISPEVSSSSLCHCAPWHQCSLLGREVFQAPGSSPFL